MLGTEQLLSESRAYGTTDERKVIALETIADQLRLIVELLTPAESSNGESTARRFRGSTLSAKGAWENEGGRSSAESR